MASPLSVFRKHQYWFLVGMGVLLMVAFVVLPPIDDYLRHRSTTGGSAARQVVARWKGGRITDGQLQTMRVTHLVTMNFLDEVMKLTIQRKGLPKGPSRRDFGDSSDEGLIATMLMAEKARQLGMVITDDAIQDYLDRLSDRLLTQEDYEQIFKQTVGGRLTSQMLFNWLRQELLAYYLQQNVLMGIVPATPSENWQNFLRVHQLAAVELLPISVDDFRSQLPRRPTEDELKQLYESSKDRYPDPSSAEPGFRRLPKVNFAYVRLDGNKLLEAEKAKITEEQVKAEYEAGLQRGDYRRRPPVGTATPSSPPSDAPAQPEASPPGTEPKAKSDEKPNNPASPDQGNQKVSDQSGDSKSPPAQDSPAKPDAPPPHSDQPGGAKLDGSHGDVSPSGSTPAEGHRSDVTQPNGERVAPPAQSDDTKQPKTSQQGITPRPENHSAPSQLLARPGAPEVVNESGASPAGLSDNVTFVSADLACDAEGVQGEGQAGSSGQEASSQAASPSQEKNQDAASTKSAPESPPQVRPPETTQGEPMPLDEVRERIKTRLAEPQVRKRRDEIFEAIRRQVDQYYQDYTIWERRLAGDNSPKPAPPNPQQWVDQFGVEFGETGLVDFYSVENTPLGKTSTFQNFAFHSFREVAFDPDVPLFRAREITDAKDGRVEYLYWKVATQEEYVPQFEEVRQEVTQAWEKIEARKLARQQAEQLREEAANKQGTLKERLPGYADKILEPPPFSWITLSVSLGLMGMRSPQVSDVEGVEGENWQFMERVFSTPTGDLGIAANAPEDHIYLFRVRQRLPEEDVLRERFLQTFHQGGMEFASLMNAKYQDFYGRWYSDLTREMGLQWVRQPRERRQ